MGTNTGDAENSPEPRDRPWLAAAYAGQTALDAIELIYGAAGADAVYATSPLDRCLRDARTAVQHI